MHLNWMRQCYLAAGMVVTLAAPRQVGAQQPADFFRQNCMSCHTIGGGRITGPDLKGVTQQKDAAWLEKFIQNPKAAIDGGDAYAVQLQQEARGVVMPTISGMNGDMAKAMIAFLDAESKLAKSQFAGGAISDRPLTAADLAMGRELFYGTKKLANGGAACVNCHTMGTVGGLGGGRLGPDLTQVYARLGGRKAVGAWLMAPATPTMQSVFRGAALQPEEILPLLAMIEDAARQGPVANQGSLVKFFVAGFAGLALGLVLLGAAWRGRFTAVRRPLVHGGMRGEE
jgi:mono/diheme cytochrome c family protein